MAFSPKRKVVCDMVLIICGYGGTGRLEGFRFLCQPACGFESHYPPHMFNAVGVSPSGKATDSDSVIRRFESCYPSLRESEKALFFFA